MDASVYILSRVDRISSQHVRELITELNESGIRICTDSLSDLVIKECLALGIYPTVTLFNMNHDSVLHIFVSQSDEARIEEIKNQYESLGDKLKMHRI